MYIRMYMDNPTIRRRYLVIEHLEVSVDYFVHRQTTLGWKIDKRYIQNHELVFVLDGEGDITTGNQKYHVQKGDLIYFYPTKAHSLCVSKQPCMSFFGVHFTLPSGMDKLPFQDICNISQPFRLEAMFRNLHDIYTKKQYLYQWKQNILMQQIICEVFSTLHQQAPSVDIARVKKVLDFIHQHPRSSFSSQELAQLAELKSSRFQQLFRQLTGTTPLQYATRFRLENACNLLLTTNLSIQDIAAECGYDDVFYFSRCFKKQHLISPKKYRETVRPMLDM